MASFCCCRGSFNVYWNLYVFIMIKTSNRVDTLNLFKSLGIEYLDNYKIEFNKILTVDFYTSEYYLDNRAEFENLADRFGEKILNRELNDLYIEKTIDRGYGLFANRDIEKDSFIGVYLGIIREEDEMVPFDESGFDTDYAWDFPDEIEGFPQLEINAKYSGNELRFANHGSEPNIDVEHTVVNNMWYIFFISNRVIKKDEEVIISYGEAYWDTDYRSLSQ
ncbi:SET domain-containing protein [Thiospirochaeta perfilievii]|uniref:SET domain-containing protein n=2 Tax=Thiospirochaeta perfilievii TaxID=252967 RepID=A0A5C1QEV7_9SPIO|nr:SET domain-containing protein [Thiospirochaeta perfilievii]